MAFKHLNEDSGTATVNRPAQRGPDEASERPRRGGTAREAPGPREARQGRGSAPLGSYRLNDTRLNWGYFH